MKMFSRLAVLLMAPIAVLISLPALAADLPSKAAVYQYPTTKCGMYYGVNTSGSTGSVENSAVGTQAVQAAIGLTIGYTCPMGAAYWFVDADFDFANFNGTSNGFSVSGPAKFEQRFGFGAPVNMVMGLIPGLSSLQNAVPSLIPLPAGVAVVTSNPYLFASILEEDVGVANGLGSNKAYLISAGFGVGNKTRLTNGVVFDPYVAYIIPSTQNCVGTFIVGGCTRVGSRIDVGMKLEF